MSSHSSESLSRPGSPLSPLPPTARPYRFNWDGTQKGPESVSGTTEGGRDYFAGPSRLNLFNNSTATLPLGSFPQQWSSSTHGFHAISTVLNNPHKRQAPPKAHSALPPVVPADLPRVWRKDFDSYLRAITPEWDRLEHSNQVNRDAEMQLEGSSTPRASSSNGPFATTPGRPLPPLDVVPSVFFKPNFNLGDPRTFNAVTEQDSPDHDPGADPTSLSYSLPLLEKFSHYADTVEQHLVREISLRSASFFAALTNLHELQNESEECLARISQLRTQLKDIDEQSAKKGLHIVQKGSRVRNLGKVREGVKFVGSVVEMTGAAKSLVAAGQWDRALGAVEEMEKMWGESTRAPEPPPPTLMRASSSSSNKSGHINGNGKLAPMPEEQPPNVPPPIPLSSLSAFAALPEHLRTLTMEITSSLSNELVSVLRANLLECISEDAPSARYQSLKDRLLPLLQGLARTKGVREATLSWREVVLNEMRGVIRRHLPAFDPADEESRSPNPTGGDTPRPGLGNHLRNLSHPEFLELIKSIYKSYLNAVEGLHSQGVAFIEVLETTSAPDTAALQEEFSDILSSAAELSNTQAAKLITIRSEQHAVLSLSDFIALYNESWTFAVKCEVICRKMIVALRGVVISQSKTFLQAFHQARLTQSATLVENEQWEQTDATPSIQHIADVLVDCAVRDAPELVLGSSGDTPAAFAASVSVSSSGSLLTPASSAASINGIPASPSAPAAKPSTNGATQSKTTKRRLRIEERTFSAVEATSETLSLMLDYLRVIINLSTLTTDTMSRIIEFLKAFNSRTCQVVLGAGAMRSAGLKNITAKHLALASQSLSIMISLIPYVRETFRRHLSQKQAVMLVEFDKLKRDYQEHQNEIHTKLIAIMGDRLSTHIRTFQAVDWNAPREGVNAYMAVLVRETVTLHKVLSRHLSVAVVEDVMAQVFAAINHRLSEEYAKLVLPSEEARKGLLADARFLHQKLSELKNVGTPSGMLEIVIADLRVVGPAKPTPPASPAISGANPRLLSNRLRWNSLAPNANGSATSSPPPPVPPSVNGSTEGPLLNPDAAGFRQVEPTSPRSESPRPESPLPALPPEAQTAVAAPSNEVLEDPLGASTPIRADHGSSAPSESAAPPPPPTSPPLPAVPKRRTMGSGKRLTSM
ncbi:vacuolar protein sorting-associated protein 54 [Roridomyces roridus]|uniref:Vacuolar protein sorting-associated protein 54 n=1 Tax=Roridomyces roridus TaxID=1738132 RepID=A0AAD7BX53_9AGAR|nr:vacuolar protein sorting-associated protein 54 [Roridomyces roridus]